MSEYFVHRCCAPYRWPRAGDDPAKRDDRRRYAVIYRAHQEIGVQYERRDTLPRNLRCWLIRLLKSIQ